MKQHGKLAGAYARALQAKAAGDLEQARSLWEDTKKLGWDLEPEVHAVFDAWLFARTVDRKFRKP